MVRPPPVGEFAAETDDDAERGSPVDGRYDIAADSNLLGVDAFAATKYPEHQQGGQKTKQHPRIAANARPRSWRH